MEENDPPLFIILVIVWWMQILRLALKTTPTKIWQGQLAPLIFFKNVLIKLQIMTYYEINNAAMHLTILLFLLALLCVIGISMYNDYRYDLRGKRKAIKEERMRWLEDMENYYQGEVDEVLEEMSTWPGYGWLKQELRGQ